MQVPVISNRNKLTAPFPMFRLLSHLTVITILFLALSPAVLAAETPALYVPITESFVKFQDVEIPVLEKTVSTCQDLFKEIQKNGKLSQRTFIEEYKVWEKFPECFVVSTSGSGIDLISNYLGTIYTWLAGIVGGVAVLMIVIGGIQIASGGGDQNNVTEGKTKIMQALTGLVVLFLSGLILYTINPTFFS